MVERCISVPTYLRTTVLVLATTSVAASAHLETARLLAQPLVEEGGHEANALPMAASN